MNVLIPLFQSSPVGDVQRFQARQRLRTSDDPEIRGWPAYQRETRANAVTIRTRLTPSFQDIRDAFNQSAREAYPQLVRAGKQGLTINRCKGGLPRINMEAVLGVRSFGEPEGLHEDLPLETPFGTLDSELAIILAPSAKYDANEGCSQIKD